MTYTSLQVANILGIRRAVLLILLRRGRFPTPARDRWGYYEWTEEDMERARVGLAMDCRRKEHRSAATA